MGRRRAATSLLGLAAPIAAAAAPHAAALCDSSPGQGPLPARSWAGSSAEIALPSSALGSCRLRLVQVIFRHGARTPLTPKYWEGVKWDCCGQPYKEAPVEISHTSGGPKPRSKRDEKQVTTMLEGGCHQGELTILGKIQALALGTWLRERYGDLLGYLPEKYEDGIISAHTTNMARTAQTLTGVISGLYSDIPADKPVQVTTAADHEEFLIANPDACPAIVPLLAASRKSILDDAENNEAMEKLTAEIVSKSGGHLQPPLRVIDLYDACTAMLWHGKGLPEWMDTSLYGAIERLATLRIKRIFGSADNDSDGLLHLVMGRLLQEIVRNMDASISGSASPKLHLYSGHDTTVVPLLSAFGMDLDHWPPYASNVVIELWDCDANASTEFYVRVLYNGQQVDWPGLEHGELCRLDWLKQYLWHRFLAHDPDEHCQVPDASSAGVPGSSSTQF